MLLYISVNYAKITYGGCRKVPYDIWGFRNASFRLHRLRRCHSANNLSVYAIQSCRKGMQTPMTPPRQFRSPIRKLLRKQRAEGRQVRPHFLPARSLRMLLLFVEAHHHLDTAFRQQRLKAWQWDPSLDPK